MKKRLFKSLVMMALLICWTAGFCNMVLAANSKISSVTLKVEDNGATEYPSITLENTDKYAIAEESDWEEINSSRDYQRARKTIIIKANEGYEFNSRMVKLSGKVKDRLSTSVTKKSSTELSIRVTCKTVEFFEVDKAYWDNNDVGTARVSKVEGAKKYRFILFVDDNEEMEKTTSNTYYDFSSKLKKDDIYKSDDVYFVVVAIDSVGNESEPTESDNFTQWNRLKGYWQNDNNSSCQPSENPRIWPGGVGKAETEGYWVQSNGWWYFVNPQGQYMTGWIVFHGEWYLLSNKEERLSDGRIKPAKAAYVGCWVRDNNKYYYFYYAGQNGRPEGEMARDTYIGQWHVNDKGACTNY